MTITLSTALADTAPINAAAENAADETTLTRITEATAAAIAASPGQAHATFRAEATAHGTVASTITIGAHRVEADEPPALGGDGAAPNPAEYLLASLLSCQIVTYRFYADRLGLTIDELTASAEGDLDVRGFFALDDYVRPGFSAIRIDVRITGPETSADYERLRQVVDRHCPILDATRNPTPVATTVTVSGH